MLSNDKTHPTMKEVYDKVHNIDSIIGQATVYRNVNKLVEANNVRRISVDNDVDHYDGDMGDHYHFVCTTCNKIIDIFDELDLSVSEVESKIKCRIDKKEIILYGKCSDCLKK